MVQIAILGFGTVGSGVAEVIEENHPVIEQRFAEGIHVKRILDLRDFPDSPYGDRVTHDFDEILHDPEIRVICETMGGVEPAFTFSMKALSHGISVCTSNKELVAAKGAELLRCARENNCYYYFEASVGGGIPLLRPLSDSLAQEQILEVKGILNGTTNYILTAMEQGGDYESVLRRAQELGYAERDPSADVEGHDPARKIAILASLISDRRAVYEDIPCEGISHLTSQDFSYAAALRSRIKLISRYQAGEGEPFIRTAPYLVPETDPLYSVSDVFNAVCITGNTVGPVMFYGAGAGKLPTASAVVADVLACLTSPDRRPTPAFDETPLTLADPGKEENRFFVRYPREDMEKVKSLFGEHIAADDLAEKAGISDEYAFVTDVMTEKAFRQKEKVMAPLQRIRVL